MFKMHQNDINSVTQNQILQSTDVFQMITTIYLLNIYHTHTILELAVACLLSIRSEKKNIRLYWVSAVFQTLC